MECIELDCILYKHIKKIKQPTSHSCTELSKNQFFRVSIVNPIKKVKLDIGLNKAKRIRKAVSVMKEDKQAFEVMLGERSEPRKGVLVSCYIFRFDS